MNNYDGLKIQHFTVIRRDHKRKNTWYFLCKCDCGKEFYASVSSMKKMKSCGCLTKMYIRQEHFKHGGTKTKLYYTWYGIISRCYNKNNKEYANYGGRGISMCDEWRYSFSTFRDWAYKTGYDEKLSKKECSIDRIDPNGNYEPSNCRWVTAKQQNNNRTNNIYITYDGETHTLSEWSEITGIKYFTLIGRYKKGMKGEKLFALEDERIKGTKIQKQMILDYIKLNGSITVEDATKMGIVNLPSRIYDLRKTGCNIERIYKKDKECGKKYAVYYMGGVRC